MRHIFSVAFFVLFVSALNCAFAQGQTQINGTVRDQSGAVLPGVEMTVTQLDTGVVRTAITNETGSYILQNLPTGPYRLEASLPGFRTFVRTGIVLDLNANPTIDAIMEVGQVTETVEVQANATMVETKSLSVRQVIETAQILELPLNGRNPSDLILLAGGAIAAGGTSSSRSLGGGVGVSVAGSLPTATTYTLDGVNHNNPFDNLNYPVPFPDALQEFSVQTGAQNATNGVLSGAQVGAVTKSGTNAFHGDAFAFVRADRFKAREYFSTLQGTNTRKQIGGTFGGPIVRSKLFFFAGYQGEFNRSDPADTEKYIPTARMLAGDFSEAIKVYTDPVARTGGCRVQAVNSTGSGATPGILKPPFVNNRVDPSLFSPAALKLVAKFSTLSPDECGLVRYQSLTSVDQHQYVAKIDYVKSDRHSIFGRALLTPFLRRIPFLQTPDNFLNVSQGGQDNLGQFYVIGNNFLVTPDTVNSARLAVNRAAVHRVGPDYFGITDLGVKAYTYRPKTTFINVTNGFSLGGSTESEAVYNNMNFLLTDDVTTVRGAHQIGFGVSVNYMRGVHSNNISSPGNYSFTEDVTGYGLADFLLGKLNNLRQQGPITSAIHQWNIGLYLQDAWKATSRLTINAGVRWEPYFPQVQRDEKIYNFSMERYLAGVRSSVYLNAPPGFTYPGDPDFPGLGGHHGDMMVFAPRLGIGFDPTGDGSMAIRASYGLTYDFVNGQYHLGTKQAPPWGNDVRISPPSFDDPWANYPGGNPFPYVVDKNVTFVPNGLYLNMNPNMKKTYVQTWNLSVERSLPASLFARVSYQGSNTHHLWYTKPQNPAVYFPGSNCTLPNGRFISGVCSTTGASNVDERRILSLANYSTGRFIGAMDAYTDDGNSTYNGLTASINRRAGRNLNVSANYTWSHCIGNDSNHGGTINLNTGSLNGDITADRANCASDRRHNLNTTAVVEIPTFANTALRYIASGWRVSNIYRKTSGSYLTISAGSDVARIGGSTGQQRATQLLADVYAPGKRTGPRDVYLNAAAFAVPPTGTLAPNKGLRNVLGPGTWQWDASLSRIFQVGEGKSIEARVEAYNVPNSFRPGNPNTSLTGGMFGQLNTSLPTRDMQFALKYVF